MCDQFTINPYDLQEIGQAGHGRVTVKIKGYWSHDPITLYINRHFGTKAKPWTLTLSHSSGGRDPKEVENDMDAAINFAAAMTAVAQIGKEITEFHIGAMEEAYQIKVAEYRAASEAARTERAARIDADQPYGISRARGIIESMYNGHLDPELHAFVRGSDTDLVHLTVANSRDGTKKLFYVHGVRTSKEHAIALLAACSARQAAELTTA